MIVAHIEKAVRHPKMGVPVWLSFNKEEFQRLKLIVLVTDIVYVSRGFIEKMLSTSL